MDSLLDEVAIKQVKIDKKNKYSVMATMVSGFENVVENQLLEILPDCSIRCKQRGKIFFDIDSSLRQLLKIKCFDNLYLFIKQFQIGTTKDDLCQIKKELLKIPYVSFLSSFCDANCSYRIHVAASRTGKHSFSRFHVAETTLDILSSLKYFEKGDANTHDLHFRIDVVDDIAYFSLKITSAIYRYRSKNRNFMPGAIRPSIANSLIWLSHPNEKDVFLDPFCGSGTIIAEREKYAHRKILAFDVQYNAVEVTKNNVSEKIVVRQGNACKLPLKDHCVDVIVSNLPWDIQVPSDDIYKLYYTFLCEALRVLKNTGRMILLTDKENVIQQVSQKLDINLERLVQINLHGLHPSVFGMACNK